MFIAYAPVNNALTTLVQGALVNLSGSHTHTRKHLKVGELARRNQRVCMGTRWEGNGVGMTHKQYFHVWNFQRIKNLSHNSQQFPCTLCNHPTVSQSTGASSIITDYILIVTKMALLYFPDG